ncbi:sugar ABC transporter ATP-binding protein [Vallitalea sp.]|uniref:sugar ABC transporter ATP-binding protein n=1 Tax=Vallitalea sp. TaxID=1882829 RepID=UPI0025E8C882|nr:sugar ABC transporter ATP-binding protein [Vallitalea sp.]MCT4687351.1 sugar ABC transporter ATP-binding protein [Vallitalea sp.]
METILEMKKIHKSFFGVEVLHGVDFDVRKGECIAICGENGAGKSTLMKILTGIHNKFLGEIIYKGENIQHLSPLEIQHKGISMIHQELNLLDEMTVAQNIYLCREPKKNRLIDFKKMNKDAKQLLERLEEIDPKAKVKDLGIAKKQIVEIAKSLSYNADLIIMDEPTAVLTINETKMLFQLIRQLKKNGVAVVYISHRLKEIKEICDRVTILRDGTYITTKDIEEVSEKDIAELMVGREIEEVNQKEYSGSGNIALSVQHVSDDFLKDVSFELKEGEILGISGLVGAGRTELAEYIFGIRKAKKGEISVYGEHVSIKSPIDAIKYRIGFATEDRKGSGLFLDRSIRDNTNIVSMLKSKNIFNNRRKEEILAKNMIDVFRVKCQSTVQKIKNLSGGNQQKIVLSKWIAVSSKILILDEPTRGVDIGARKEIYDIINRLAEEGKSVIVISSDLTEVLAISQRVLVMHQGEIRGEIVGDEINEENIMILATGIGE